MGCVIIIIVVIIAAIVGASWVPELFSGLAGLFGTLFWVSIIGAIILATVCFVSYLISRDE